VGAHLIRQYTYAFAAVSPHDGVLDSLVLPAVNAQIMSIFLAEVADRHADEYVVMVLDGAGWHQAKELDIPENMMLVRLPAYSPELNPTEHLWDEIREKWFPNLVFKTLDAVEDVLVDALRFLENAPGRITSLTGFDWIVSIPLIAT
jgi:transposase